MPCALQTPESMILLAILWGFLIGLFSSPRNFKRTKKIGHPHGYVPKNVQPNVLILLILKKVNNLFKKLACQIDEWKIFLQYTFHSGDDVGLLVLRTWTWPKIVVAIVCNCKSPNMVMNLNCRHCFFHRIFWIYRHLGGRCAKL